MKYRIYALLDPKTKIIRYVGLTTHTIEFRLEWHYAACDDKTHYMNKGRIPNNPVAKWVRALKKYGMKPLVILLEETNDRKREKYWIQAITTRGNNLFNVMHNPYRKGKFKPFKRVIKKK